MGAEFNSAPIFIGVNMNKDLIIQAIIDRLIFDRQLLIQAASSAHQAATDPENLPDNKHETLALEASYLAQGQANRAQEITQAIELYQKLSVRHFTATDQVFLTAFMVIESSKGMRRSIFLGPAAGGLKFELNDAKVVVITPDSPLGKDLLGKEIGDVVEIMVDGSLLEYELIELH